MEPGRNADFLSGTAIVGSYTPNPWGLYDMHGNVQEWCLDWGGDYFGGIEPAGPLGGGSTVRSVRGGAWNSSASGLRSVYGVTRTPNDQRIDLGFRIVRVLR